MSIAINKNADHVSYIINNKDILPLSTIAKNLNLTSKGIRGYLKANDIPYSKEVNGINPTTSKELEFKIIEMIKLNRSLASIAKQFKLSYYTINKILKAYSETNLFSDTKTERNKNIIALSGTMSSVDISKKLNISVTTLYDTLKTNNITPVKYKKCSFNEDYFETIDTERKAYWLGFIMADGSVSVTCKTCSTPNRLAINISIKDIELLELIRKDLDSKNVKIKIYTPKKSYAKHKMCRINFNSVKMCNDLLKYGIGQNKTGKESIPNIPHELQRHFIRGFFDGDGTMTRNSKSKLNNTYKPVFGFTSANLQMLLDIRSFLYNKIETSTAVTPSPSGSQNGRVKNSYQIAYGKESDNLNFYHYIYDDSTLYLSRKYNKFTSLLSQ